jgi:hypothetical protein
MRKSSLVVLATGMLAVPALADTVPQDMPQHHSAKPAQVPPDTPAPDTGTQEASPVNTAPPVGDAPAAAEENGAAVTPQQRQAAMASWPANVQAYYRSLPPPRQETFWLLTDAYKVQLAGLDETQRAAAWEAIEQELQNRAQARPPQDR